MNAYAIDELDIVDLVREAQISADVERKPYSICVYFGRLIILATCRAIESGYTIIETCRPTK